MEFTSEIDGLPLWVFDDVLPVHEHDYMYSYAINSLYSPTQVSDYKQGSASRRMASTLTEENIKAVPTTQVFNGVVETLGLSVDIETAYINFYDSATVCGAHIDSSQEGYTMLYYPNTKWELDWGGETLFFNAQREIAYASVYKPNRVIFFDARILHTARPPTTLATDPRFTIAYKSTTR